MPDAMREYLRTIGAKGGAKGGRWKGTTPEERSEYMRGLAAKRINPGRKRKQTDKEQPPWKTSETTSETSGSAD